MNNHDIRKLLAVSVITLAALQANAETSTAMQEAMDQGKAIGGTELDYWTAQPINKMGTEPSNIIQIKRVWNSETQSWESENISVSRIFDTSVHGQKIVPDGWNMSTEYVEGAYQEGYAEDGRLMATTATMAEEILTGSGECLNPDPSLRPEGCDNVSTQAYGAFRRESMNDRPDVSNKGFLAVSRGIFENAEEIVKNFGECNKNTTIIDGEQIIYRHESQTCIEPIDYSGVRDGTHSMEALLLHQNFNDSNLDRGTVSVDGSKKYSLAVTSGSDSDWLSGDSIKNCAPTSQIMPLVITNPNAIKKVTLEYVIFDDMAEFWIANDNQPLFQKIWDSHPTDPAWTGPSSVTYADLPRSSSSTQGYHEIPAPQYCESDRYLTANNTRSWDDKKTKHFHPGSEGTLECSNPNNPSSCTVVGYEAPWYHDHGGWDYNQKTGVVVKPYNVSKETRTIGLDITSYFKVNPGQQVNIKTVWQAGVVGGGVFNVSVEYHSGMVLTFDEWGDSKAVRAAIDAYSEFAEGEATCTEEYKDSDFGGDNCVEVEQVFGPPLRICESDIQDTMITDYVPGMPKTCRAFTADVNYTYFQQAGEEEDHSFASTEEKCADLKAAPNCEIQETKCLEGAVDPRTGLCMVEDITYDCVYDPVTVPSQVKLTFQCEGATTCLDGTCSDTLEEVSDWADFAEAAGSFAVQDAIGSDMFCSNPEDPNTCTVFSGKPMECRQFLSDGFGAAIGWDQKCCEKDFGSEEEIMSSFTKKLKQMLGVKTDLEAERILNESGDTGDSSYKYIKSQASTGEYNYSNLNDYLVNTKDNITGTVEKKEEADAQEIEYTNKLGAKVDETLTDLFGTDYGPAVESLGMIALEAGSEMVLKNYFEGSTLAAIMGPVGWVMMVQDIGKLLSSLFFACQQEEMELWQKKKLQTTVYIGKECSECLFEGLAGSCTTTDWRCVAYTEKHCVYENMLGKLIQEGIRGDAHQLGLAFGTYSDPDCTGISIEQLQQLDWSKVDMEPWIHFLLSNDIIPKDIDMSLTGDRSKYKLDGVDRLDAAQRAVDRLTLDDGMTNRQINESAEETVERRIDTTQPWYNNSTGVNCEFTDGGVNPEDRPECQTWAKQECGQLGYAAHPVCSWLNDYAESCNVQDLDVTLGASCQEFRVNYCEMPLYANSIESCGIMGDWSLMTELDTCESADWQTMLSNSCLQIAEQVCGHPFFAANATMCNPLTGPVGVQANFCLEDPTDASCLIFNDSPACTWEPLASEHPVCVPVPWDNDRVAVECEFESVAKGSGKTLLPEERNECRSWAIQNCDDPANAENYMCAFTDAVVNACGSDDPAIWDSSSCQQARIEYCPIPKYKNSKLCNTDEALKVKEQACVTGTFTNFVSNDCQDVANIVCDDPRYSLSPLCTPTLSGPAYDRAQTCDTVSTDYDTLTSPECLELTQSIACDWAPWDTTNAACLNPYGKVATQTCTTRHEPKTDGSRPPDWATGISWHREREVFFGLDGTTELKADQCYDTTSESHAMTLAPEVDMTAQLQKVTMGTLKTAETVVQITRNIYKVRQAVYIGNDGTDGVLTNAGKRWGGCIFGKCFLSKTVYTRTCSYSFRVDDQYYDHTAGLLYTDSGATQKIIYSTATGTYNSPYPPNCVTSNTVLKWSDIVW
jgi:hypothetical protein